jgi:glycosyltransferase involved in cell wall biosynthesis
MTARSLTILQLAANRWWTGSADPILQLATGLRERGHRVLLGMIPGDRFEAKAREAGFPPIADLRLDTGFAPAGLLGDIQRLRGLMAAERVDVVHTHHSHDHWLALLTRRGRRTPVPVARTFHNLRAVGAGRLARERDRRTDAVFAVSRQVHARCREVGIAPARIHWLPGAADLSRFKDGADRCAVRTEFQLGDAPVVVSVARLAPNRGHELLLAAFRQLLDRLPAARLLLVGKGEARPHLEGLVTTLGLTRSVVFTGYRDRDLPEVLAAADCFALMAAGSDESCRAVLEAMASARPVVARRVGALPETIVHGETGLLIDDDRPEGVAAALGAVLRDRDRGRAMGSAGRRRAETEFNPERSVEIVEAVYRTLT